MRSKRRWCIASLLIALAGCSLNVFDDIVNTFDDVFSFDLTGRGGIGFEIDLPAEFIGAHCTDGIATSAVAVVNVGPVINLANAPLPGGAIRTGASIGIEGHAALQADVDGFVEFGGLPVGKATLLVDDGRFEFEVIERSDLLDLAVIIDDAGTRQLVIVRHPLDRRLVVLQPGDNITEAARDDDVLIALTPGRYPGAARIAGNNVVLVGICADIDADDNDDDIRDDDDGHDGDDDDDDGEDDDDGDDRQRSPDLLVTIGGDLTIQGNVVHVRGVSIEGTMLVTGNDAAVTYSGIGAAVINGNAAVLLGNLVSGGTIVVTGNDVVLLDNFIP